jgi:hypothetical protein
MKLYHEQIWVVPGKQGRGAERVDVPTTPAELADWLNDRRVTPAHGDEQLAREQATPFDDMSEEEIAGLGVELLTAPERPKVPGRCDRCGRSPAGTLKLSCGHDLDELGQWLEDVQLDQLWMLQRAAELIRDRVRALGGTLEGGSVQ